MMSPQNSAMILQEFTPNCLIKQCVLSGVGENIEFTSDILRLIFLISVQVVCIYLVEQAVRIRVQKTTGETRTLNLILELVHITL